MADTTATRSSDSGPAVTKRKASPQPPSPAARSQRGNGLPQPGRLVAMATAILVLGIGLGMVAQSGAGARPSLNAVDVGFLQDMRTHHDQAVQMSLVFISKTDVNATLRQVAGEILLGQQFENGAFVQLLDDAGKPTVNDTGTAMGWMGMATSSTDMPGMATDDQIASLRDARGTAADRLFVQLMVAHHQGGIDMARYAQQHGRWGKVRSLSGSIITAQTGEINDLDRIKGTLG